MIHLYCKFQTFVSWSVTLKLPALKVILVITLWQWVKIFLICKTRCKFWTKAINIKCYLNLYVRNWNNYHCWSNIFLYILPEPIDPLPFQNIRKLCQVSTSRLLLLPKPCQIISKMSSFHGNLILAITLRCKQNLSIVYSRVW